MAQGQWVAGASGDSPMAPAQGPGPGRGGGAALVEAPWGTPPAWRRARRSQHRPDAPGLPGMPSPAQPAGGLQRCHGTALPLGCPGLGSGGSWPEDELASGGAGGLEVGALSLPIPLGAP